jgi:DNA-binding MarR family transcriptional regulator
MWLSAEEQAAWRPFAALLFRLPAALDAQLQKDSGISHFEYMVLSALSEAPGRTLRMSDLAAMASGSLSRLSHVVSRMESRGWVRREACPGDGRFINAVLTEEGWAKVVATAPGHVAAVRKLLVDVLGPEELQDLGTISEHVLSAQGFKGGIPNGRWRLSEDQRLAPFARPPTKPLSAPPLSPLSPVPGPARPAPTHRR